MFLESPALAGRFFTTNFTWEAHTHSLGNGFFTSFAIFYLTCWFAYC